MPPTTRVSRFASVPAPARAGQTISRDPTRPDSTIAQSPKPASDQGQSQKRSDLSTYITKVGKTDVLYDGSRLWARCTLTLESAGPVVIGTKQNLLPVLSGKGILLTTGVPKTVTISKGDRLYIAANAVSRVSVEIEAFAWLEQIFGVIAAFSANFSMLSQEIQTRLRGGR